MKIKLLIIISVPIALWVGSIIYDNHYISKGVPPGFYLECDPAGNYRPCRDGSGLPLAWMTGSGSKAQAIRRAWRQVKWDAEKGVEWKRCDEPTNSVTETPIHVLLEPIQAEAARRGDNYTAAAINFLQAAIVEGKQKEFAFKVKQ